MRVIIAGLDQDYTGKPWEPMPQLLAIAEYITKTHAICMKCGQPANYTQRTFESEERVAVGGAAACTKQGVERASCHMPTRRRCMEGEEVNRNTTNHADSESNSGKK